MQKIKYEFNDGSTQEIPVTDEFYKEYQKLVLQEKHNTKRETRRHISLDDLTDMGIDLPDENIDGVTQYFEQVHEQERLKKIMSKLNHKQQKLFRQVYIDRLRLIDIAKLTGATTPALCQQLATIHRKLKLFFEKP